jgi:hypothetical protein
VHESNLHFEESARTVTQVPVLACSSQAGPLVKTNGSGALAVRLRGSDRRSTGDADAVARDMCRRPRLVAEAIAELTSGDPVLQARCADALEKASRSRPGLLQAHKAALLTLAATSIQAEVRWHLAPMLARLELTPAERRRAVVLVRGYLADASRIVRVLAMQALWDLTDGGPRPPWLLTWTRQMSTSGPPSLRARARRLLGHRAGR